MSMSSGLSKLRKQRVEKAADRGGVYVPDLKIMGAMPATKDYPARAAMPAIGWLIGGPEEPMLRVAHRVKLRPKNSPRDQFKVFTCSGKEDCVWCYVANSGAGYVNGGTDRGAFSFGDARYFHKVQLMDRKTGKPVLRNKDNQPFMVDELCRGATCKFCKSKSETEKKRERGGRTKLDLSTKYLEQWLDAIDKNAQFCASCWEEDESKEPCGGTIEHIKWVCGDCGGDVAYDPEMAVYPTCQNKVKVEGPKPALGKKVLGAKKPVTTMKVCGYEGEPREEVVCSNGCENAKRVTAWDGPWKIEKSGSGTSTAYNFVFLGVKEREPWLDDLEPVDLAQEFRAFSVEKCCKILNIRNPFQGGSTSSHSETDITTQASTSYTDDPAADEPTEGMDEEIPF